MNREIDALVHTEVMQKAPRIVWIATNDGGVSACASTHPEGPWPAKGDLEEWLERQQAKGHHKDYEIGQWERYPPYSTDWRAAGEVVEKLHEMGLYVSISKPATALTWDVRGWNEETNDNRFIAHAETAPLTICLAALDAVGVEVPE